VLLGLTRCAVTTAMGNFPSVSGATGAIGMLELNQCACCAARGRFEASCCCCCPQPPCCRGLGQPSGPDWQAALRGGFGALLAEAEDIAAGPTLPVVCGARDVFAIKAALDAAWTARACAFLEPFNLRVEAFAYVTHSNKSSIPHLALQFFELVHYDRQGVVDVVTPVAHAGKGGVVHAALGGGGSGAPVEY